MAASACAIARADVRGRDGMDDAVDLGGVDERCRALSGDPARGASADAAPMTAPRAEAEDEHALATRMGVDAVLIVGSDLTARLERSGAAIGRLLSLEP